MRNIALIENISHGTSILVKFWFTLENFQGNANIAKTLLQLRKYCQ